MAGFIKSFVEPAPDVLRESSFEDCSDTSTPDRFAKDLCDGFKLRVARIVSRGIGPQRGIPRRTWVILVFGAAAIRRERGHLRRIAKLRPASARSHGALVCCTCTCACASDLPAVQGVTYAGRFYVEKSGVSNHAWSVRPPATCKVSYCRPADQALSGAPHRPSESASARGNLERISRLRSPLLEDRGAGLITSRSQPGGRRDKGVAASPEGHAGQRLEDRSPRAGPGVRRASMTPRERVLTALRHETPDRTPCDFWAEPPTWNRLMDHVGHQDRDRFLDDLGVDVRHLEAAAPPERPVGAGVFENFWGERYIYESTRLGTDARGHQGAPGRGPRASRTWRHSPGPRRITSTTAAWPTPAAATRTVRLALRVRRRLAAARTGARLGRRSSGHGRAARLGPFPRPQIHRLLPRGLHAGRPKPPAAGSISTCSSATWAASAAR